MRQKNFKGGRCTKRKLKKCEEVAKMYDKIQLAFADVLDRDPNIKSIRCNVPLDDEEYMTDFLCTKQDGDLMVRECVFRKFLMKPLTVKLLDASRLYWLRHGVVDWGVVIDAEKQSIQDR